MIHCESNLIEKLKGENNIYIYGAGEIGHLLERRLRCRNIAVSGFCVSDKLQIKREEVTIDTLNECDFVIVAVGDELRDSLVRIAKEKKLRYDVLSNKAITTMKCMDEKKINFQIHVVEHCNLNCRGCYHFSPLAKAEYINVEEFESDFNRMSVLFEGKADQIVLLGGEPLLHPRINELMVIARQNFKNAKIKILTNGTLLLNMDDGFFCSLRENNIEIWVTKYPIDFDYDKAKEHALRVADVKLNYFNEEPVRTLGHQPLDIKGSKNYKHNYYNCYRANICTDLKHGKLFPCIIPAEIGPFNDYFKMNITVTRDDYVDIYEAKSAEDILESLDKPMPFCRFCDRENISEYGVMPWSVTKRKIEEWIE